MIVISAHATNLATYTLSANKTTVYEKEAVVITFDAFQKDHTDNMMFSLEPKKSNDYEIILLNKKIDDSKHHASHTTFHYLLFALQAKTISVDFDFTIRTASDQAVAQSYVDDHDGSIGITTHNSKMQIKPLKIHVKKLQKPVTLVGDFSFKERLDTTKIDQFGSVNIVYTLSGKGYEDKNFQPIKSIKDVTIFAEKNDLYLKASREGYVVKRDYIYALSAKKDFTIPTVSISAFSPRTGKYYTLTTPQHHITVEKIDTGKLLDNEEFPQEKGLIDIEKLKEFFIYLLIFLAGYITAKFQTSPFKKKEESKELREVKKAQTPKALLFALINNHLQQKFTKESQMLEDMVYNNAAHNFNTLKNTIIKGLK
jgi:hypothetical protein